MASFPVSLDPPNQARLYSELELMICSIANQYLLVQKAENRMSSESVMAATELWHKKNRPQVLEFRFDQSTQWKLVWDNFKNFRFYGPNAENVMRMHAMMNSWKVMASEMSIRTFCAPDSMIKKHLNDSHMVLEMLDAPTVAFEALNRMQAHAQRIMSEAAKIKKEYPKLEFGQTRKWEPPTRRP